MRLPDDPDHFHGGPTATDQLAADRAVSELRAAESRARQDRRQADADEFVRAVLRDVFAGGAENGA